MNHTKKLGQSVTKMLDHNTCQLPCRNEKGRPPEESMMKLAMENNLSQKLQKKEIYAYQASKRGGYLHCTVQDNDRITVSGEAALVAVSEITASL